MSSLVPHVYLSELPEKIIQEDIKKHYKVCVHNNSSPPLFNGEKILLLSKFYDDTVKKAANNGFNKIIEISKGSDPISLKSLRYYFSREDKITVSLLSSTVYEHNIAFILTELIYRKLNFSKDEINDIKTAINEATLNAVMHGNLGLSADYKDWEQFTEFYSNLKDGMADDIKSRKRIDYFVNFDNRQVRVTIKDQGLGFCTSDIKGSKKIYPYGRGLKIIRDCVSHFEFSGNGSEITLYFDI